MNSKFRTLIAALAITGFGVLVYTSYGAKSGPPHPTTAKTGPQTRAIVEVKVPDLQGVAVLGERAYVAKCAACHGENAVGQLGVAPPLVHKIYEPSHHGDMAFTLAAKNGVRAHHWRFGNMPPVAGITDAEVETIIAYVRTLQRANGIF